MKNNNFYRQELPPIWLLILLAGVGPLGMNITLPATTDIMLELESGYGLAQMVLTVYLLATAVAQLFLGQLSDLYGRRPVMIGGFAVFCAGSVICALATDIHVLLAGRVIQGMGGSVGISLSRVIVRDVYDREKSASLIGYITMAMVVTPMLGPLAGGLLTEYISWHWIFWFTAALAAALLVLVLHYLHETRKPLEEGVARAGMLASFGELAREPAYLGYIGLIAAASGMYFVYLGGAPYIFTELMNISPSKMGLYFMLNAVGYAMGNFASGRCTIRVGSYRMVVAGLMVSGVGLVFLWGFYGVMHPLAMSLPMLLITLSNGLTLPGATSASMSVRPELSGAASGIAGALQIGVAALLTLIIGFLQNEGQARLFLIMTACALFSVFAYNYARRHE